MDKENITVTNTATEKEKVKSNVASIDLLEECTKQARDKEMEMIGQWVEREWVAYAMMYKAAMLQAMRTEDLTEELKRRGAKEIEADGAWSAEGLLMEVKLEGPHDKKEKTPLETPKEKATPREITVCSHADETKGDCPDCPHRGGVCMQNLQDAVDALGPGDRIKITSEFPLGAP